MSVRNAFLKNGQFIVNDTRLMEPLIIVGNFHQSFNINITVEATEEFGKTTKLVMLEACSTTPKPETSSRLWLIVGVLTAFFVIIVIIAVVVYKVRRTKQPERKEMEMR